MDFSACSIDEINYHAKNFNIPLLHLIVDEQTGEAGFITRLEAFIDMLVRKKLKKFGKIEISSNYSLKNTKSQTVTKIR